MEYDVYPCEARFPCLVRKGLSILAGFRSEADASDYALSVGGIDMRAPETPRNADGYPSFLTGRKTPSGNRHPVAFPCAALRKSSGALWDTFTN